MCNINSLTIYSETKTYNILSKSNVKQIKNDIFLNTSLIIDAINIVLTPDTMMRIIQRITETVEIDEPSALRSFIFYKNVKLHNGINNYITSFLKETNTKRNPVTNAIHANSSNDPRLKNLKIGVLAVLRKMIEHPEITNANRLLVASQIERLERLPTLGKKTRRYKKSKKSRKTKSRK
jgi:hypothetical protein